MAIDRPILLDVPERFLGPRILLRPFAETDVEVLHAALRESREHLQPWGTWPDQNRSLSETREYVRRRRAWWITRERLVMGIFARREGSLLGSISVHVGNWKLPSFELGYWLRHSAQGHGYITEAARLLTIYSFETLKAQRMLIRCDVRNVRSKRVPERLGYSYEGCLRRSDVDSSGKPCDMLIYALIADDYRSVRASWAAP